MPFGKRASRCCCDPVVSPCSCNGDFDNFQVVITGMTDVACSGNATLFNGTHTIGRGDNYPALSHTCFGKKGFRIAEYNHAFCSYGVAECEQQSVSTTDGCFGTGSNPGFFFSAGCGYIDARVRTSPTNAASNFLLQVSISTTHSTSTDRVYEYWVWEADIPKVNCTSVVNQSLTKVSEQTWSDVGINCDNTFPRGPDVFPCSDCNSMSSATVTVTLL